MVPSYLFFIFSKKMIFLIQNDIFELLGKIFITHLIVQKNLRVFLDDWDIFDLGSSRITNFLKKIALIPELFVSGIIPNLERNKCCKRFFFLKFLKNGEKYLLYFPNIYMILKLIKKLKFLPRFFTNISNILRRQTNSKNIFKETVFSCFLDFRDFSLFTPISLFLTFRDSQFLKKKIRKRKKKTKVC